MLKRLSFPDLIGESDEKIKAEILSVLLKISANFFCLNFYFTAPRIPETNLFCCVKKSTTVGIVIMHRLSIKSP